MNGNRRRRRRGGRVVASGVIAALMIAAANACGTPGSPTADGTRPAVAPSGAPSAADNQTSQGMKTTLHTITKGGHKLAFYVTPGRMPAIVLDAGGGLDSSYWKNLVPALAKSTGSEIITYDRAGLGASDEVPGPWNVQSAVSDLATGLTALGVTHHAILVSHSEAGEIATYLVLSHPHWITGAVLVDASLPEFSTDSEVARIIAANKDQVAALASQPSMKANRQLLSIAQDYGPAQHAYHQLSWPRDVPAIAIVSSQTPFPTSPPDAQLWRDAQAEFVRAAPNRRLVLAANSSHDVPLDRPDVVIKAVAQMIATTS